MAEKVHQRLAKLGISLPRPAAPAANYLPFVLSGGMLFISGQLCTGPDGLITGKLGTGLALKRGQEAARLAAINVLAQASAALDGDLDRIGRLVRITGFVASDPGFTDQHLVVNGASDFLVEALGEERGRHARAAVGVPALPLDAAVEIDAIIAVR